MQEFDKEKHMLERNKFYGKLTGFFPNLGGLEYALYDIMPMKKSIVDEIANATNAIWQIYRKVYGYITQLDDADLEKLGFDKQIIHFMKMGCLTESFLARLDLIVRDNGEIKLMENNSDTPFFELECFEINGKVAEHFGYENPNKQYERDIANYYLDEIKYMAKMEDRDVSDIKVVITGHNTSEEELKLIKFIQSEIGQYVDIDYVPILDLQLAEEDFYMDGREIYRGLYTPEKYEYIDILIRTGHPIDFIIKDKASDGSKIGIELLKLVDEERITILNPPESYAMQPKALMALIWNLKDEQTVFDNLDKEIIEKYFLPTYLNKDWFIENNIPFVQKANIGREGDTVKIYDGQGNVTKKSMSEKYNTSGYVYQQYVELPDKEVTTVNGKVSGKIIVGSFIVQNEASAFGVRFGSEITESDSYWLPVGLEKE